MPGSDASSALAEARRQALAGHDLEAKLLVAAAITTLGEPVGVVPLVTGGTSVDFYVAGALEEPVAFPRGWRASLDVDLVNLAADSLSGARRLRRALRDFGFEPAMGERSDVDTERGWRYPDVPVAVEVIGGEFEGDVARVVKVEVDGHVVRVRGPEDTLWEHLEWGAHTRDQRSWTRALAIARAQRDRLDVAYLRELAGKRGYGDALEACLAGEPLP